MWPAVRPFLNELMSLLLQLIQRFDTENFESGCTQSNVFHQDVVYDDPVEYSKLSMFLYCFLMFSADFFIFFLFSPSVRTFCSAKVQERTRGVAVFITLLLFLLNIY